MAPIDVQERLVQAMAARDPAAFDLALNSAHRAGLPRDLVTILAEGLAMVLHTRHEDVARALQERTPIRTT